MSSVMWVANTCRNGCRLVQKEDDAVLAAGSSTIASGRRKLGIASVADDAGWYTLSIC